MSTEAVNLFWPALEPLECLEQGNKPLCTFVSSCVGTGKHLVPSIQCACNLYFGGNNCGLVLWTEFSLGPHI